MKSQFTRNTIELFVINAVDITDNLEHIFECNSNYHNEWRDIQVGTKTVTVPEKSHYETKTEVVGRKCTVW